MIRQPIVTIAGHVDHGKTSILDQIRGSSVQEGEAGGITQKISFTKFPADKIKSGCGLLDKYNVALEIPGFLFIDTPGHAAFTNLRKRGGSLADLAVLVIDIKEGIKPQTAEVLQILKNSKTPFIIALNKCDFIKGWPQQSKSEIKEIIETLPQNAKQEFEEKFYTLIGALQSHGYESDLYYKVEDFTKKVAMIPMSAKTGQGIQELLMMLCGLSQRFLKQRLSLAKDAKGIALELKKEKAQQHLEAILYDGELKVGDKIAIATFSEEPIIAKIKSIQEIQSLSFKYKNAEKVTAATGIRIQFSEREEVLPGMPFQIYKDNIEQIQKEFKKELAEEIKTDKQGIIIKADSLGSLEALLTLLKQENIKVVKAGIGSIKKSDIISAKANQEHDPLNAIILGFNVKLDEEAKEIMGNVKVLEDEVVYKLIEDLQKWQQESAKEIEKQKLMELATVCKLKVLPEYVFRNSNPAVFGVKIEAGKLKSNTPLINQLGEGIARVKAIQADNNSVEEASQGQEVAISLPGTNYERQIKDKVTLLYSDLGTKQFKKFKENKDVLSQSEIQTLQEIKSIKQKKDMGWGG
ncbi:MAG: translation initiation factor IF-2 [Nanoarchaeota archaeon]|nr:translation initiation factor IF-2 [Nanoarchaeota archaeon]